MSNGVQSVVQCSWCSVLQCGAVWCGVVQCVAVCYSGSRVSLAGNVVSSKALVMSITCVRVGYK